MSISVLSLFRGPPFKGQILNALCMSFLFTVSSISLYCSSNKAVCFQKYAASDIEILGSLAIHISLMYNKFFKMKTF